MLDAGMLAVLRIEGDKGVGESKYWNTYTYYFQQLYLVLYTLSYKQEIRNKTIKVNLFLRMLPNLCFLNKLFNNCYI